MKNFKKLTLLVSVVFSTGAVFSCQQDSNPSFLTLKEYQPNSHIRECVISDRDQAHRVLRDNKLDFSLDEPLCLSLVYEKDGLVKGVCIVNMADGYVYRVAVKKEDQNKGIGKALLYEAANFLREECGIDELSLHSKKQSVGFYKNLGFVFDKGSLRCSLKLV